MPNVKMYTKPGCPYCTAARENYNDRGVEFEDINVIDNPMAQEELLKLSNGQKIVPVIIDNGEVKIGWGGG
ncbi:MAG: glutaredoxin family protein [candidate division Zixibacteria bacterium]